MNNTIISMKEKELRFLKFFHQQKYNVVDFNLIEELDWRRLTHEDLQQMDERSFWQQNKSIYALRNDFTDQLFRYYSNYPTHFKKVAYAGDIIRDNRVIKQVGIENYEPQFDNITQNFLDFQYFIQNVLHDDIQFVILGHYQLIDALLEKNNQTREVMEMIEERNLSGLIQTLTFNHPIIQILKENTLNQLKILSHYLPEQHPAMGAIQSWAQWFTDHGITEIHLDVTAQAPRSYYKGIFIKCHLKNTTHSVLTGGYYHGSLEGFGLGLTL